MTTKFTRTTRANEISVTYEVSDERLDENILDAFEKLRLTDDCSDGKITVRIRKSLSERGVVSFNLMYDHGEYEALVSKGTKELLSRLFDLEKEMRDLDNLI